MPELPDTEFILKSSWFVSIYLLLAKPASGSESQGRAAILACVPSGPGCPSLTPAGSALLLGLLPKGTKPWRWLWGHCQGHPAQLPQGQQLWAITLCGAFTFGWQLNSFQIFPKNMQMSTFPRCPSACYPVLQRSLIGKLLLHPGPSDDASGVKG